MSAAAMHPKHIIQYAAVRCAERTLFAISALAAEQGFVVFANAWLQRFQVSSVQVIMQQAKQNTCASKQNMPRHSHNRSPCSGIARGPELVCIPQQGAYSGHGLDGAFRLHRCPASVGVSVSPRQDTKGRRRHTPSTWNAWHRCCCGGVAGSAGRKEGRLSKRAAHHRERLCGSAVGDHPRAANTGTTNMFKTRECDFLSYAVPKQNEPLSK